MNNQKKILIFIIAIIIYFFLIWPRSTKTNIPTQKYINNINEITKNESAVNNQNSAQQPTTPEQSQEDSSEQIVVDLRGAIVNPGIYKLDSDVRMYELIKKAGGFKEANQECVNQAQILSDEQLIIIPSSNEECSNVSTSTDNNEAKLNINEATVEQLTTLPGIGQTRAQQIIDYRDTNGKFKSIDDLKNVNGIGEQTFLNISELISV